jgi:transposase
MQIATIGLDIAKNVFYVYGVDSQGQAVVSRQLRRRQVVAFFSQIQPALVGIEACATSHYWARQLMQLGHGVRLMPPHYVRPYVKRQKSDAMDAEAICEAITRPRMRFVAVKSADQQASLTIHRARHLLVRQRTMLASAIRAHLAEFGLIAPQGIQKVDSLIASLGDDAVERRIPELAREAVKLLVEQFRSLEDKIAEVEAKLLHLHRGSERSQRLSTIPGVGPITASALTATVSDPAMFRSGRDFAAWLGLTPRQHSTGGKERLGGISKQGDRYLRHLLFIGARNVIRYRRARAAVGEKWLARLLARRPPKVAAAALANKMARIAWAMMVREETFRRADVEAVA